MLEVLWCDLEGLVRAFQFYVPQQLRVPHHEVLNVGCRCGLTNRVGYVNREEIARLNEAADGFQRNVVCVAEVGLLPIERLDCGIGSLPNRGRLGTNDRVLAIRLVPDGDNFDPIFDRQHACL